MKPYLLLPILISLAGTGCTTHKGAKKVTAHAYQPVKRGILEQSPVEMKRRIPGALIDPEATTYAQVTDRIIYMPGNNDLFSRTSPRQEVAYHLTPVSKVQEIRAEATPILDRKPTTSEDVKPAVSITLIRDGNVIKGVGRRLGVLDTEEKNRANNLLKKGESLEWKEDLGYVGFTTVHIQPVTPPKAKQEALPEIKSDKKEEEKPHGKAPEIQSIQEKDRHSPKKDSGLSISFE
jgi:hypothetical protein